MSDGKLIEGHAHHAAHQTKQHETGQKRAFFFLILEFPALTFDMHDAQCQRKKNETSHGKADKIELHGVKIGRNELQGDFHGAEQYGRKGDEQIAAGHETPPEYT